jgi:serine/threonine-protein kinase
MKHPLILTTCLALAALSRAAAADDKLPQQAYAVLKTHCYRCHGIDFKAPGLNVLDADGLRADRGRDLPQFIVPGKLDSSYLWQRIADGEMPPSDADPISDADKEVLRRWIEAGAIFPGREPRAFRTSRDMLTAVRDHLAKSKPADRPFQRYFTLTHLYNNHQNVTADELRLYRAALAKLINSLSWQPTIVVPKPIDADQTIFCLDLRDVGWDRNDLWREILQQYPYGLKHDRARDRDMAELASELYSLAGSDMPYIRADWFISTASRPPLYHKMLELPETVQELEKKLNVDVEGDFLRNRLARAGFATSGVSGQNRLVDRHAALHGAYWKSYDFKSNEGRGNLFRFPLGPDFASNPFKAQAFAHDGGEMIFNLPNGLQGYFLSDGAGKRIDAGPIEVVSDALKTSGTPAIVNGLSCMACHKHGTIRFKDTIAAGLGLFGEPRRKVEQLFTPAEGMEKLVSQDEARFLQALSAATGEFLRTDEDAEKEIREFAEPVAAIAREYQKDIGPADAAFELGINGEQELKRLLESNTDLMALGLGPLASGEKIKRETWHSLGEFLSQFQRAASALDLGTPHRAL